MYSSPPYDLSQLALIAGAYRPFGQSCCGTGDAPRIVRRAGAESCDA